MRSIFRSCFAQNAPILAALVLLAEPPLVEVIVMVKGLFERWDVLQGTIEMVPEVGLEPTRLFTNGF